MSRGFLFNAIAVCCIVFFIYLVSMRATPQVSNEVFSSTKETAVMLSNGRSQQQHTDIDIVSTTGARVNKNGGDRCMHSSCRLIIVNTMTYEHIFKRPNLARTAAQLLQAGPKLLWVVTEDTHSLRKMTRDNESHYAWIIDDTHRFLLTLGIDVVYIAHVSVCACSEYCSVHWLIRE